MIATRFAYANESDLQLHGNTPSGRVRPSIRLKECDTYQGVVTDPISLHKYLYANADPMMGTDPSGRTTLMEEEGVAAGESELMAIRMPALATARATATSVIEISHLYTRFAFAAVAFGLTVETTYYAAKVLQGYPDLVRVGDAIRQAKNAALNEGTYTKRELDNMPIFFVFKVGPYATSEIWDNDAHAMKGEGTRGGVRASDVLRYKNGVNDLNRPQSLAWARANGIVAGPGQSLDEYPYASTQEGGARDGLRVAPVPVPEQNTQMRLLGEFYRDNADRFMRSTRFLVVLVP